MGKRKEYDASNPGQSQNKRVHNGELGQETEELLSVEAEDKLEEEIKIEEESDNDEDEDNDDDEEVHEKITKVYIKFTINVIKTLKESQASKGELAIHYRQLANRYQQLGLTLDAVKNYKEADLLHGHSPENKEEAQGNLEDLFRILPIDDPQYSAFCLRRYQVLGEEHVGQAIMELLDIVDAHIAQKDYITAAQAFQKMVELNPTKTAEDYCTYGQMAVNKLHNHNLALHYANEAWKLNKKHRPTIELLVFLHTARGSYQEALDYLLYKPTRNAVLTHIAIPDNTPGDNLESTAPLPAAEKPVFKITPENVPTLRMKFDLPAVSMLPATTGILPIPATLEAYKLNTLSRAIAQVLVDFLRQQIAVVKKDPLERNNLEAFLLTSFEVRGVGCISALTVIAACEDPNMLVQLVDLLQKIPADLLDATLEKIATQKCYGYTFFMYLCRSEKPALIETVLSWLMMPCWAKRKNVAQLLYIMDTGTNHWTLPVYLMFYCERKILYRTLTWMLKAIDVVQPNLKLLMLFLPFLKIGNLAILCLMGGKWPASLPHIKDLRAANPNELIINKIMAIFDKTNLELLAGLPRNFLYKAFLKTDNDKEQNFSRCVAYYSNGQQLKQLLGLLALPCIKESFSRHEQETFTLLKKPIGIYKSVVQVILDRLGRDVFFKINDWLRDIMPNISNPIESLVMIAPPASSSDPKHPPPG